MVLPPAPCSPASAAPPRRRRLPARFRLPRSSTEEAPAAGCWGPWCWRRLGFAGERDCADGRGSGAARHRHRRRRGWRGPEEPAPHARLLPRLPLRLRLWLRGGNPRRQPRWLPRRLSRRGGGGYAKPSKPAHCRWRRRCGRAGDVARNEARHLRAAASLLGRRFPVLRSEGARSVRACEPVREGGALTFARAPRSAPWSMSSFATWRHSLSGRFHVQRKPGPSRAPPSSLTCAAA